MVLFTYFTNYYSKQRIRSNSRCDQTSSNIWSMRSVQTSSHIYLLFVLYSVNVPHCADEFVHVISGIILSAMESK